jgi:amidohydrolase
MFDNAPFDSALTTLAAEAGLWRRDFHAHPELQYEVHRTAGIIAQKLRDFGCDEVVTGIGRTGVVGVIEGRSSTSGKVIALRADMDALPILETTNLPYRSTIEGRMHACGHDGHSAMLLGAAQYLARTRNFDGKAVLIFQPAEEGGAGGEAMIEDGVMERFGVQEVYGLHNLPGLPVGQFAIRSGAIMAAADHFTIMIEGKGGHAAWPHDCIDPVMVASHVVLGLQTIVSRSVNPLESAVISVCALKAGDAFNVIPQDVTMLGTVRSLREDIRDLCEARINAVVHGICTTFGATARIDYHRGYPVTVNHDAQTTFMANVAAELVGADKVNMQQPPMMGAEDFSFMLNKRPGAYIFMGNGDSAGLHHPAYDFNDQAIPYGMALWTRLIETAMPL